MKCYFLRHGNAVEPAEWRGSDDDRPLTPEGIKRMHGEAKAIADFAADVDVIVTSPLLRARQTADIVADRLRLRNAVVEDARIAHGFNAESCGAILRERGAAGSIVLVGHEPTMSAVIGSLCDGANVELKKGGLAGIELADRFATSGTLICLIPPKVLIRASK
jgi:phosphohistidine phosphatase